MVVLLFCISIIAETAYFFKMAPALIFQKYFRALIYIYYTDSLPPWRHHAAFGASLLRVNALALWDES